MLSYHTCPLAILGGKDTGGMNVYVRELTRQLGKLGIAVDVFTRSQDEHVPHVLHDLGYGNRVVHIPAGPESPLPKQELSDHIPEFIQGILDFAETKNLTYDLIHSHYWLSGIAGEALKSVWHIPMIQMFHTLGLMKQRVARLPGEAEGDYRIQGEREVLRTSDRIIAATQAELAQLQWLYQADARKISIIPPGVDLSRFYPIPADEAKEFIGVPPCDKMLLFVGRIEPLKGIDTLIKALALMRQENVFVCLSVIGGEVDGDEEEPNAEMSRLKSMREDAGVGDLVTFLGKRSQHTLPYYYSAAEAVVVPSFYESFGMVALEAMACGTPVVASQVGGLAFLVQDGITGFTVPVDDPQALSNRLTELVKNPILRQTMSAQAVALAQNFGWDKIASRIVEVYTSLINHEPVLPQRSVML
ncbi:MAG: putative glycosyltransferase [Chloroflexi bacterium]|nr:putative glycosyltransferase [Chloroflexota bacterium]